MSKVFPEHHSHCHIRERLNRSDSMLRDGWENPLEKMIGTILARSIEVSAHAYEKVRTNTISFLGKLGLKQSE